MQQEGTLGIGARTDRRAGPVDRSADERLSFRIAHDAAQVLRLGGGRQQRKGRNKE